MASSKGESQNEFAGFCGDIGLAKGLGCDPNDLGGICDDGLNPPNADAIGFGENGSFENGFLFSEPGTRFVLSKAVLTAVLTDVKINCSLLNLTSSFRG